MLAGPVDYTQGAMKRNPPWISILFTTIPWQPERARQVATYVVFDNPLVMLCDNPTAYMKEKETTDFITQIPVVWDETRILQGKLGEFIVSARRNGSRWFVGGLTDWTPRTITLDLSFWKTDVLIKPEYSKTV